MQNQSGQVKKKWYLRWWMWAIYIFIILLILGSNGSSTSVPTTTSNPDVPTVRTQLQPTITVTADKLMDDYKANEVAADAKYKNAVIQVSGVVDSIGKDILDTPYISLYTGGEYSINTIQCMFSRSDEQELATVSKNQSITLIGRISGKLGNIILNACSIAK